ncbi:aspartyl protease [Kordia sp. SMS9]|uniref:aspartyl protease family protein n=1 Tax=Kordia sp. SMS9 TaxID=2282170 RepID=UPI000E10E290|nr:aspartyl protease family protein [Kordia sp. SMS9]AXG69027.1 aspartyl protease [Kordia sp. SMS9]
MHPFYKYSLFGMILVFVSCSAYQQLRSDTAISADQNTHQIPFDYVKGLMVVEANLQQKTTKNRFIFDTGAFQSKVEYSLAEHLQLLTKSRRSNGTAQGIRRTIETTVVDSILFDDVVFYGISAGKLKYDAKSYSPCVAPDGIIGANLIKLANWKIDFQKQLLTASKNTLFPPENTRYHRLDFRTSFRSGIPKIDIEVNGKLIKNVLFDVGFNGGLVIPENYVSQFPNVASEFFFDQSTSGIFGSNRDTLIVKKLKVQLGDFHTEIPVQFSSLHKALLGTDFLEHFTIYLDYDHQKIILQPLEKVAISKEHKFIPGILSDSLWIVNRTVPNSKLQLGDTLKAINGFAPKALFTSHCDYFLNISKLLHQDTLFITTQDQKIIPLYLSKK